MSLRTCTALAVSAACVALMQQPVAAETIYTITPLVTDSQQALADAGFGPAMTVDPNLINPWGMSAGPTSPFWVSNQGSNTSTLYDGDGNRFPRPPDPPLVVDIPQAGPPAGPTGQVFAFGTGLTVPSGGPAIFAFANLDGSISAWTPGSTTAQVVVPRGTVDGAVYTGLTITATGAGTRLYAANNAGGSVDVFDSNYQLVTTAGFDPGDNPDGLVPFNVKALNGQIYVTFAPGGPTADESDLGTGFVAVFDTDGNFVRRFTSDQIASPWGLALAPDDFGDFSNALLVGNFNEEFGYIGAYDPTSGAFLGLLEDLNGLPLNIPDLWELLFGNGVESDVDDLYFVAGIGDELHGLFGEISASEDVPEPAALGLFGLGMLAVGLRRRRARTAG